METPSLGAGFSYSIQGAWSYLLQIGLDLRLFLLVRFDSNYKDRPSQYGLQPLQADTTRLLFREWNN